MAPEIKEYEDYKVQEKALDLFDDMEKEILNLMLKYAGEFAKENNVKIIDPEQMKAILRKALNQVLHDQRFIGK